MLQEGVNPYVLLPSLLPFSFYKLDFTYILPKHLLELLKVRFSKALTHQTPKLSSYRNQSIDLQGKLIDWFQYDGKFGV